MTAPHRWKFHRAGGLEQVSLSTAQDLENLAKLDQKLWIALSCPTHGLELDPRTLELLDADRDGRVRAADIRAAIDWCKTRLKTLESLLPGQAEFPLSAINGDTPEGQALLGAARHILKVRGTPETTSIGPNEVSDVSNVFQGTAFNGDGVISPASAENDTDLAAAITDAVACTNGVPDRSGAMGIDAAQLEIFASALAAYAQWWESGNTPTVQTLGEATPDAWKAVAAVRSKVDDYFHRCRLAAYDSRAGALLNHSEAHLTALASRDLSQSTAELAAFPIALVDADRPLPLAQGMNPAWAEALNTLFTDAVLPVLGNSQRTTLTAHEWSLLVAKVASYDAWQARKQGVEVEKLGIDRVRQLLSYGVKEKISTLINRDQALEPEARAIADVVSMVYYHRDLHTLLRNFVSFSDFYDPAKSAIFQAGTLYIDSRSCNLCIRVEDPGTHATLASLSRMYIAYCDCRRADGASMKIAACFTQGDCDFLMVGRNGVFYDRQGRDWDATLVKIVENPISIRQAFFAPYKKFVRFVEEQVAKFAAAKDQESSTRLANAANQTLGHATGAKAAKVEPMDVGKMVGIIAAIGVGAGALGTLFGSFVSGFMNLSPWWAKLVALLGIMMVISGPSVLIAWLKLRQRTLGPVLDANGWAVNGRVKVNLALGNALTTCAAIPAGAVRSFHNPYEDRTSARLRIAFWLLVVLAIAVLGAARWYHYWPFHRLSMH